MKQNQRQSGRRRNKTRPSAGRREAEADGAAFYRAAIDRLQREGISFLVGGAYALEVYAGIVRRTKDFDIFLQEQDVGACLRVLSQAGYRTELTFPHWLGKAYCGEEFIDVIFSSGNGLCRVDSEWFRHRLSGCILGVDLGMCPVEEIIWQKSFILERDRCDVADVAHLLRHRGAALDWHRLLRRFGELARPLVAQVVLFDFIYPGHHDSIPQWVRDRLWQVGQSEPLPATDGGRSCFGTLLSASQYLRDVDCEGYRDVRLPPTGDLTPDQVAIWTANFMHH